MSNLRHVNDISFIGNNYFTASFTSKFSNNSQALTVTETIKTTTIRQKKPKNLRDENFTY